MPALSYHSNVHDSALALLRRKGFQVWKDGQSQHYGAERDGWDFFAYDPVELVGLVAMFEASAPAAYCEYWWRDDSARGLEQTLPSEPERPYVSVTSRRDG